MGATAVLGSESTQRVGKRAPLFMSDLERALVRLLSARCAGNECPEKLSTLSSRKRST